MKLSTLLRVHLALLMALAMLPSVCRAQAGPTEEHKTLATEEGVWDAEVTFWHADGAEPMKSKGKETNKMLGKMWLLSDFEGDFGGEKFTGHMQLGYDPIKKKFVGTWIDTMSPFLQTMEGEYDEETKTATMISTGVDPKTGQESKSKMVTRHENEDAKVFEMHMPVEGEDDKWWKAMEIKYKRQK